MDKIRWGILSTANIARWRLIPAMKRAHNAEPVAVASRRIESARAFADANGIPRALGSYEALIEDPNLDAIYIPLPNALHKEWSIRCAEAGKPTLCEKPLSGTADDAQAMVDAFAERGIPLAEAFMYRFHPRTDRVREVLADGAVGQLHLIDAIFSFAIARKRDVRLQPNMAGGALRDLGSYCVNVMRLMTGEEPEAVRGIGHFGADSGVEEWVVGALQFPSGVLGSFGCGMRSQRTHAFRLRGSEGTIEVPDGFGPEEDQRTEIIINRGKETTRIEIPPYDQYQVMVEDFSEALLTGRAPRYSPNDAVANLRVLDRLQLAIRE